ncbi:DUF5343 domain-containing protein [Stenotrophomonas pavanii]|uniref:DUF5343 domain-containing protein n=1 Tax=Stenotrophomonas pavanii TaxID=487698 RepID=UPI002E782C80|nr:DUF5343 domain-containing protein [Stenotrophomonas pavanii]HDS1214482.1 DUF5343 domain-containing protein [Stenotrophomonas maltophilia]
MADAGSEAAVQDKAGQDKAARRKIPGGLPYTTSPGVLKGVLDKIPHSEKPHVFNTDFISTVLGSTGGAARQVPPILKTAGLLSQSGAPTELYSQFQTDSGRSAAAVQILKNGFAEVFRRNQFAHKADEATLTDIVVSVTGLPKKDAVVRYIINTFKVFQEYAKGARDNDVAEVEVAPVDREPAVPLSPQEAVARTMQLAYNINVVLPETTNVEVYNAIFRSLKANLLT